MIMISYRRADATDMAGRISDQLVAKYGEKSVFFDFDSIPTGANYRMRVAEAMIDSEVVIAVISPQWLGTSADGKSSRIAEANDNVRFELETAISHAKPILPLLIGAATMPMESELPEWFRELSSCSATRIDSGQDFRIHMARLSCFHRKQLEEDFRPAAAGPRIPTQSLLVLRCRCVACGDCHHAGMVEYAFWVELYNGLSR